MRSTFTSTSFGQVDLQVGVLRALDRARRGAAPVRLGHRLVDAARPRIAQRPAGRADLTGDVRLHRAQIREVGRRRIARDVLELRAPSQDARQPAPRPPRAEPGRRRAPRRARQQRPRRRFDRVRHVAEAVAAERFVAAVAAQRHRHVALRHAGDVERRNRGRVGERLVEAIDDAVEHLVEPRLDDLDVMAASGTATP